MLSKVEPKNFITNFTALLLVLISFVLPNADIARAVYVVGCFALSGALTNWLAIYMLFEKIPGLYGSGVIPRQFKAFKLGIRDLIMHQFFSKEQIEKFFNSQDLSKEVGQIKSIFDKKFDGEQIFNNLVDAIMASQFGGALAMFGGADALLPLKEPVIEKLKTALIGMMDSPDFTHIFGNNQFADNVFDRVEILIDGRLNELTPKMVKDIIQKMIRTHLGWLVVWGGVFGGIIGLIFHYLKF